MHARSPSSPVPNGRLPLAHDRPTAGPSSASLSPAGARGHHPPRPTISTSSLGRRVKGLGGNAMTSPLSLLGAWPRKLTRKPLAIASSLLGLLVLVYLAAAPFSPSSHAHAYHARSAADGSCHPYHAYGHLTADPAVPERNRYHPFAPGCAAPELMRAARHANGVGDSDAFVQWLKAGGDDAGAGKKWLGGKWGKRPLEDVSWLRGRSVLLVGDSTVRNQLEQFCTFLGEPFTIHPPADAGASGRKRASKDASYTHACYAPKLDLLVVSVFHFGLDQENFWRDKDSFNPPSSYEDRLRQLFVPIALDLEALLPEPPAPGTPKRTVDLIELSTGLWDLARFAKLDIDADESTISDMTRERLLWYAGRVADVVGATLDAFPGVKLVWRSMHWPSDKDAKVDWFMGWNGDDESKHRPFFHHNRILQLEQAARSAILPDGRGGGFPGVEVSEWGSMLLGQHVHQLDQLHPGPLPAGYLGSDIMLYELREAVQARLEDPLP